MIQYKKSLYIFFIVFALAFSYLRIFYGINVDDESFYIGVVYRVILGDKPFYHEIYFSQISSLIMLPIISLFLKINGGTDGLIFFCRNIYFFLTLFTGYIIYISIKEVLEHKNALLIGLAYTMFLPLNMPALGYYHLGSRFSTLALFLFFRFVNKKGKSLLELFIIGGLFGLSIISHPYFGASLVVIFPFLFYFSKKSIPFLFIFLAGIIS